MAEHNTGSGPVPTFTSQSSSPPNSRKRKQDLQYPGGGASGDAASSFSRPWSPPPFSASASMSLVHYSNQESDMWNIITPPFHQHAGLLHEEQSNNPSPSDVGMHIFDPVNNHSLLNNSDPRPVAADNNILASTSSSSSNTDNTLLTASSHLNYDLSSFSSEEERRHDPLEKQMSFTLPTLVTQTNGNSNPPFPGSSSNDETAYHHDNNHMRLNDLGSIHERNQHQLIQSWVGGGRQSSTNSAETPFSPATPSFFTPSFLESLQEDDDRPASQNPVDLDFRAPSDSRITESPLGLQMDWQQQQEPSTSFPDYSHSSFQIDPPATDRARTNSHDSLLCHSSSPPQSPVVSTPPSSMYGRLSLRPGFSRNLSSSIGPPTIPEAEDEDYAGSSKSFNNQEPSGTIQTLKAGLVTARILASEASAAKLRPLIQSYLQAPDPVAAGEKTVVILTSKVAQKSYGTEKRFLCPPPTAVLLGTSWWVPSEEDGRREYLPPRLTVSITGEATSQASQIEWYTQTGTTAGQTSHPSPPTTTRPPETGRGRREAMRTMMSGSSSGVDWCHDHERDPLAAGRCVSKNLYINDADEKRKRVEALVRIQLGDNRLLGTLASKGIKVISKPSKKRQSVKNMDLCIHHGTPVSLFNRIRSQTVSTKYLGVSSGSSFAFSGFQPTQKPLSTAEGTCFVARTTSWDPFVIWIVDTSSPPSERSGTPEDYIGKNTSLLNRSIPYPPPPAIALRNTSDQPIPIHYNQHVVLQCLTTGLVSPVMIIRKVEKASTIVGGARCTFDDPQISAGGGEFGDEALGDPVSQLHKIALQIVHDPTQAVSHRQANHQQPPSGTTMWTMPRSVQPATYLACLNDMVGMHKTTEPRKLVTPPSPSVSSSSTSSFYRSSWDMDVVTSQEGGKVVRKRRVSSDYSSPPLSSSSSDTHQDPMIRRRVNSLSNDAFSFGGQQHQVLNRGRSHSISIAQEAMSRRGRRMSLSSSGPNSNNNQGGPSHAAGMGTFWSEDVSDAAVWTIVGTDCAMYRFWSPDHCQQQSTTTTTVPFPSLSHISHSEEEGGLISLHGENFTRDLQVWLGDIKLSHTEYRGRELLLCRVPSRRDLCESMHAQQGEDGVYRIPILLVRGEGVLVHNTNHFYCF